MSLIAGSAKDGTGLAGAIASAMGDSFGVDFDVRKAKDAIDALAKAIVEYIVAESVVTVPNMTAGGDTGTGTLS